MAYFVNDRTYTYIAFFYRRCRLGKFVAGVDTCQHASDIEKLGHMSSSSSVADHIDLLGAPLVPTLTNHRESRWHIYSYLFYNKWINIISPFSSKIWEIWLVCWSVCSLNWLFIKTALKLLATYNLYGFLQEPVGTFEEDWLDICWRVVHKQLTW